MVEHRRHPRVPSRLRCWCEGENVTVYARVGNISEGGLFVRTATPLLAGATATLRFGQEVAVETHAVVIWVEMGPNGVPHGMGLKFAQLDGERAELIRRLIQSEQQAART